MRKFKCYICDICRIVLSENWIKEDGKDYCRACWALEIVKTAKELDCGHHHLCNAGLGNSVRPCSCGLSKLREASKKFDEVKV